MPTAYTTRVLLSAASLLAFLTCLACRAAAAEASAALSFGVTPATLIAPWWAWSEPVALPFLS